jgi:hypothetical protein
MKFERSKKTTRYSVVRMPKRRVKRLYFVSLHRWGRTRGRR